MEKKSKKEKLNKVLKELFALAKEKFSDVTLKDGSVLRSDDDTIIKGSKVMLVGADGTETDVTDGDYTANDGSTLTIKSGVVDTITPGTPPAVTASDDASAPVTAPAMAKAPAPAVPPAPAKKADAKMDAVTAPVVPSEPDGDEDEGAMDNVDLINLIKNLVERVSSLEDMCKSTAMSVQKMSAAPAAKPFNFDPFKENTIGSELEKYKAEQRSKNERIQKQSMEFMDVSKKEVAKTSFTAPTPKTNLNLFPSSFQIEIGK